MAQPPQPGDINVGLAHSGDLVAFFLMGMRSNEGVDVREYLVAHRPDRRGGQAGPIEAAQALLDQCLVAVAQRLIGPEFRHGADNVP